VGGPISWLDQIQDDGRPLFWKKENRQNSAAISDIFTEFGLLVAMDSPQRPLMSFLGYNKIQDGGRPPSCPKIQSGITVDAVFFY